VASRTRKEAYIEACGLGLPLPLAGFDASVARGEHPAQRRGCTSWSARLIDVAPHCAAAIVAESSAWQMEARAFDALALLDTHCPAA
jgi:hypothetical protein